MLDITNSELVKFYASFREAISDKDFFHLVSMVSLKDDGVILGCPTACTVRFQFCCEVGKINTLTVDAFNYGGWFAPFAHLHPNFNGLLLHTNGAADTQVLGKAARRTDVGHSRSPVLLCNRPQRVYR